MKEYEFEFIVQAQNWDEVVQIFNDELGIEKKKRNSSDRDIDGYFLVSFLLDQKQINNDFYTTVRESDKIAIVSDERSEEYRYSILREVEAVEAHLRKLLIHVSDIVDDYYKYFDKTTLAKKFVTGTKIVAKGEIDPLTSHLMLDEMMTILNTDLSSWDKRQISANDMLEILESGNDLQIIKSKLKKRIKRDIVWNHISKNLLQNNTAWEDIALQLDSLKRLRNKAAHFRTCSEKDSVTARKLSSEIIKLTHKRSQIATNDLKKLRDATYPGFSKVFSNANRFAEILAAYQRRLIDPLGKIDLQMEAMREAIAKSTGLATSPQMQALIRRLASMNQDSIKYDDGMEK